ncbi:hypothetical protein LRS12_13645 [Sphingomonas sp. J344]|nr:hypothetical protein [Sphingomonas sp. J344]MCR5871669.1 hypothetical protein [Sphingomonas sp. J344]
MLWSFNFTHDANRSRDEIKAAVDAVIEDLRTRKVTPEELARARTKMRSSLYSTIDGTGRIGLIDLLAVYALFDNDPNKVNTLEDGFAKVTPELIQKTAQEYLRPTNRSIYVIDPGAAQPAAPAAQQGGK